MATFIFLKGLLVGWVNQFGQNVVDDNGVLVVDDNGVQVVGE